MQIIDNENHIHIL